MIFLGLIFSGPQSLVIKGVESLTQQTPIVWMSVTTRGMVEKGSLSPRIVSKEEHGLVLHLLGHLVGVEDARHRHLHFSLLLLGGLQRGLEGICFEVSSGLDGFLKKTGKILIASYLPLFQV